MKEDLLKEPVLAMYDVRGIQEYVFRTNKVKEIVGASIIVAGIFEKALNEAIKEHGVVNYSTNWRKDEFSFPDKGLEVIYAGGGNTLVLFKSGELCQKINRYIAKYILENTYSLNLAVAVVPYTGNYNEDYKNLSIEMGNIKAQMPLTRPIGNFPLTRQDLNTGYPLSEYVKDVNNGDTLINVSKETKLKLEKAETSTEKEFDKMVTDKGSESLLAIVHIDGNNMGTRIGRLMKDIKDYKEAVIKQREISKNIEKAFNDAAYKYIENELIEFVKSDKCDFKNKKDGNGYQKYIRSIINAGDDITFVCNAKVAISLCEIFLKKIKEFSMFNNDTENYGFSACAGIAIINSHFPFYEGYNVAEECCSNAKKRAKKIANGEENIVSFIDFQICKHIATSSDLEKNRDENYNLPDATKLLLRPYCVDITGAADKYSLDKFKNAHKLFTQKDFPKNWAKKLRNAYNKGKHESDIILAKMNSRKINLPNDDKDLYIEIKGKVDGEEKVVSREAKYFDVLEMLDLYIDIEEKEAGTDA